jgi:hypothetical protein
MRASCSAIRVSCSAIRASFAASSASSAVMRADDRVQALGLGGQLLSWRRCPDALTAAATARPLWSRACLPVRTRAPRPLQRWPVARRVRADELFYLNFKASDLGCAHAPAIPTARSSAQDAP